MTITCTVPLHAIDERLEREGIRLRRDRFFIPTMAMKDILGLGIEPRELAEKYMTFYETIPFYGSVAEFVGKRAVEKAAAWKSPPAGLSPSA